MSQLSGRTVRALYAASAGKRATEKDYVGWVAANAGKPEDLLDVSSAPCDEGVGMLLMARMSPRGFADFFQSVWPKVLVKSDLERGAEERDDMHDIDECILALEAVA